MLMKHVWSLTSARHAHTRNRIQTFSRIIRQHTLNTLPSGHRFDWLCRYLLDWRPPLR